MEELELVQKNEEGRKFAYETERGQSSVLEETQSTTTRTQNGGKRNPPARNTSRFWFERFLAVIQRQNPSVIDSSFLTQVAPNNEGKLLAQLKFLHVIDEEGKPTDLLSMLNMVGAEQKKGFQKMIKESYGELVSEIVIEKAVPEDVVNFFIRHYAFTRDKAINASKFFLYLSEKGSLAVSPELSSLLAEKSANLSSQVNTASSTILTASSANTPLRLTADRAPRPLRESHTTTQRKSKHDFDTVNPMPSIQTVINITLDKDTPQEYWDRVLAFIGEGRNGKTGSGESQVSESSFSQQQNGSSP